MKNGKPTTMWCRYYTIKGKKYYDKETLSYTRKGCKDIFSEQIRTLRISEQDRIMKESTFEKVSVTISSL